MRILAPFAYIIATLRAYNELSNSTGFAHHCTTINAMDKVLLMNRLIIAALITCGVLLRASPMGVCATEVSMNRIYATINIIAYACLAVCTGMGTSFSTLTGCHLCYRRWLSLCLCLQNRSKPMRKDIKWSQVYSLFALEG